MDADARSQFLQDFPPLRDVTSDLERRYFIPANPETMTDQDMILRLQFTIQNDDSSRSW